MTTKKSKVSITDANGEEIKGSQVRSSSKLSTPKTDVNPEFEKPLVSVSISNPFKKILYWLDQIRKNKLRHLHLSYQYP